ncbi:patatin-like phospholipase family protein [Acidobacteria bacterium AH-259-A15]|nr:patatin-like phospholipase family protein [Acidobacteria bacterium AH-259-A15]
MAKQIKVLSIDGGGIRGIIPAMLLAEIEKRTKKRISQLFDLIGGTSTGGILALGLTKPDKSGKPEYTATDMVDLYEKEGPNIFSRSVWHRISAMGNLVEEKYPAEGITEVLKEYFGSARLRDALTEVLITSYEIERRIPFFFKSAKAKKSPRTHDFLMRDVARATSAAPTYFEPLKLEIKKPDYYALIDGGVFANNPAMCSLVEARTLFPKATDFLVLSLGTGELTRRLPYDEAKGWGLTQWAQPLLNVVFDGVSDTVDYQLAQLLPADSEGVTQYYRFQTRLNEGNDDMDDAGPTNLRVLKLLAEAIIRDNDDDLTALSKQLRGRKP